MKTNWLMNFAPIIAFAPEGEDGGSDTTVLEGGDTTDDDTTDDDTTDDDTTDDDTTVLDGDDDDDDDGDDNLTDEEKAAAAKAAEVPEDGAYEYDDLPEGVELSDDDLKTINAEFKELGLSRGQAQALITMQSNRVLAEQEALGNQIKEQQQEHLTAAKSDKDIGGDNWKETVAVAGGVLRIMRGGDKINPSKVGKDGKPITVTPDGTELREPGAIETLILNTGNGNNPEILRELRRLGETMGSDKFRRGRDIDPPKSTEASWYGDTTPATKRG